MNNQLISLMIFVPLIGALLQPILPAVSERGDDDALGNWVALAASLIGSIVAVFLAFLLQAEGPGAAIGVDRPWIGSYAISYNVAVDGMNVLLVLLVAIVFPILVASEWNRKSGRRGMQGLLLVLQMAFFGTVCAHDIFVMFFFWALSSLPFYFLVAIWGGKNRERAASHAIAANSIGNALVFAALILVYYSVEPHSFSLHELAGAKLGTKTFDVGGGEFSVAPVAFLLISLGLALRAPIWPFHGWFTESAKEAPASVLVALAGVGVPVATYIFVKLGYTLFPETIGDATRSIEVIALLNLLVCGAIALAQRELRMVLAFLCLSEVGMILLGVGSLEPAGIVGASYQQMVLGFGLAGFGLLIGIIEGRVGNDRFAGEQNTFGRLVSRAPSISMVAGILVASLLGFPGLGGFVGHSMIVIGSFSVHPAVVLLIGAALLMGAYYLFNMYKLVFLGPEGEGSAPGSGFQDLSLRERAYLAPLIIALLFCGIYPKPLIELVRPAAVTLLSMVTK